MKDSKFGRLMQGAALLRQQFAQYRGGVFSQVPDAEEIVTIVATHVKDFRERIYPPLAMLRLFIGQALSADRACQDVVGRRLSERVAQGKSESTLNTGPYCEARARLPVEVPIALGVRIGERLESMASTAWRWQGRIVKLFDGTTVSMPGTVSNQQAFPQSREQKPGLGFPVARIGALIGLAGGAVLGYRLAACEGKGSGGQGLPRALSFTGAKRVLNVFADQLRHAASPLQPATVTTVLTSIAKLTLPHRPGRIEPRAKKRRPKNLPLLTILRHPAREAIRVRRGLILAP